MKLLYTIYRKDEKSYMNFYIGLDNGRYVAIKRLELFNPNDYAILKAVAYPLEKWKIETK